MKRVLYLDCPAGIAGDMTLAALVHAGADVEKIKTAVDGTIGIETHLEFRECVISGLSGLGISLNLPHEHAHRTMGDIRSMIETAAAKKAMTQKASDLAIRIFSALAKAEGRVHGMDPEDVHFHEVGALDSIVDIVGIAAAIDSLDIDQVAASPLPMTRGLVKTMHGLMPIPAPATIAVLSGFDVRGEDVSGEFVTPTGAAVCAALAGSASPMPPMTIESSGLGFGTMEWPDKRPNCVRAIVGLSTRDSITKPSTRSERTFADPVLEMSANIDDSTPEQIAWLNSRLLDAGALDAWAVPVVMKKGRPAWTICALLEPRLLETVSRIFFLESTTIGIRFCEKQRIVLNRTTRRIETSLGEVQVKKSTFEGVVVKWSVEPDDLRRIAAETGRPLREVRRIVESEIE